MNTRKKILLSMICIAVIAVVVIALIIKSETTSYKNAELNSKVIKNSTDESVLPNENNDNNENPRIDLNQEVDLDSWVGEYEFYEFAPPDENMNHNINIYKENNKYFADLVTDGFQTKERLKAQVLGNKKEINLVFEEYMPDNNFELYKKGDILLSLKKEDSNIITTWVEIEPLLIANKEPGNYFKLKT